MNANVFNVAVQFEHAPTRHVASTVDMSNWTLARLRKFIIESCAPGADVSPFNWTMRVDGVIIAPFDAMNRKVTADLHVEIFKKGRESKKRVFEEVVKYDPLKKIQKMLLENRAAFESDRDQNGLVHEAVFALFGHISVRIASISDASKRVFIRTDANANQFYACKTKSSEYHIVLEPYFSIAHVSLLCMIDSTRFIHCDASSSFTPINSDVIKFAQTKQHSLTFIPFQMFDESNSLQNLAGGNCSMFTCLAAIRCILGYPLRPVRASSFWPVFERVLSFTHENANVIVRVTMRNIACYTNDGDELSRYDLFSNAPLQLCQRIIPDTIDFTADMLILEMLDHAKLGFHQVSLLGNVLREMLREMQTRGFISRQLQPLKCEMCNNSATFQCVGECSTLYCGNECHTKHVCA